MTFPSEGPGRAQLIGLGLIGGSIGLALRAQGWRVSGSDLDPQRAGRALEIGVVDEIGWDREAGVVFVATPVAAIAGEARRALETMGERHVVVTDVGGVKAPIVAQVDDPRFIGGHPMAGSEQEGLDGADADAFVGATWVLTPTERTDPQAFSVLRSVISSLGADVVALPPERHDALVAVVSHVPHLTAATLMALAADSSQENAALLRLAAGGFRDMTRIAAGHPAIWPDVCADNAEVIVGVLDGLIARLAAMREIVANRDRDGLLEVLEVARAARRNLPSRLSRPDTIGLLRIPVPDRPGVLSEVTTVAGELGINIYDLEIAHSAEGPRGVLVVAVDATAAEKLRRSLAERGYRPAVGKFE